MASTQQAAPGGSNVGRPKSKSSTYDDSPLWSHVNVVGRTCGGGNRIWNCKYCNLKVTGSYTKVKAHLLKRGGSGVRACKGVNDATARQIEKEHEEAKRMKERDEFSQAQRQAYHKRKKGPIDAAFNVHEREEADKECAMMFYTGGISFNFARNPWFRRYSLREHADKLLQPLRDSWAKKGVAVCSDGWSNIKHRPVIINIMLASAAGPMFKQGIDASNVMTKDAPYIASIFCKVIQEIGDQNVVQVITDNGSNYKAVGQLIEKKYPHIFWTPCVVHCLNLVFKAICDPSDQIMSVIKLGWFL